MTSVREVARSLEQWEMNAKDAHRRMVLAQDAPGAGPLARRNYLQAEVELPFSTASGSCLRLESRLEISWVAEYESNQPV